MSDVLYVKYYHFKIIGPRYATSTWSHLGKIQYVHPNLKMISKCLHGHTPPLLNAFIRIDQQHTTRINTRT